MEQIREKLWSSWKLTHGWWLAFSSSGGGSRFSCFSAAQPRHCLQCKEVQGLPPSAGKTEKNTSYGSNHPPEALPPGLKHLGPVQVQDTEELTQFCIRDPTTELRHGKNSKQSRAQVHLNNISKSLYGAHHVPDIAMNALYVLAHLILIKIG